MLHFFYFKNTHIIIFQNDEHGSSKYDYIDQSLPNTPTSTVSNNSFNSYSSLMQKPHTSNKNEYETKVDIEPYSDDSRNKLPWIDDNNNKSMLYGPSYSTSVNASMNYGTNVPSTDYHSYNDQQRKFDSVIDPYNDSRHLYYGSSNPVLPPTQPTKPKNFSYYTPQELPCTSPSVSQLNLTSNELYNADINYMNNYLKSLPDYNLLVNNTNLVTGDNNKNSEQGFNYNYYNNVASTTPMQQYPLSKSNSFQSFNMKPKLYQYHTQENFLPGAKAISRSTSSHAIPHHIHMPPPPPPYNVNDHFQQLHPQTAGWTGVSNVGIGGEGLSTRPPTSGPSKPRISEFWKENLNSSTKQPKVGWNYNKIMSKTKDELQNTINRYKNNIANLNNSVMNTDNPYKLCKNYSYTNMDIHLRETNQQNPYEMMYKEETQPISSHFLPQQPESNINFANFNPITSASSNYSLNSFYSPVQPVDLSYRTTNTTPPPPPGFKALTKSMSNTSVPSYLNSNPVPYGNHLQKTSSNKVSYIPIPTKTNQLSKSNSNSLIMQLPSVNLNELSSYFPQNLSKSSSSSCIYAKTLSQPSHLRKTNDIFSPYKGFDVSDVNKTVSKNTELIRNEKLMNKKPVIGLKPSNSFSSGVRPNIIFQRPVERSFERLKALTPIAKCFTDTTNVPPNENLPAASFASERINNKNDFRYEPLDYSMKSDPIQINETPLMYNNNNNNSNSCLVNIEDNIGRSIADIYDVGNNYNHIYGSSPSKKPSSGIPLSDFKSNLNPEAKNFTPLTKSTTVKYIPQKVGIKTPPESSYLSSPHLVRKIMRSNTINFNSLNKNQFGNEYAVSGIPSKNIEKCNQSQNTTHLLENPIPQSNESNIQQQTTYRDNNNNKKQDSYYNNYQEDILRQFDPYFNASTDTNAATASTSVTNLSNVEILNNVESKPENILMTHDYDVASTDTRSSNSNSVIVHKSPLPRQPLRHASSSELFLDCNDDNESDILDDADLDADDEDEGAPGMSTTESVSEYMASCGYPFKKSKKYSHQFSQSNSNDGSKLQISGTDESGSVSASAVVGNEVEKVIF